MPEDFFAADLAALSRPAGTDAGFPPSTSSWTDRIYQRLTRWRISLLTQIGDMILIINLAMLTLPATQPGSNIVALHYLICAVVVAVAAHFSFFHAKLYEMELLMDPLAAMKSLTLRWSMVFVTVAAMAALTHTPGLYSRLWFLGFYGGGIVLLGIERWLVARAIRAWIRRGHHCLNVAIVGGNELTEQLITKFRGNPWGINILGVFDDRSRERVLHITGVAMLGTVADLLDYSKTHDVDLVVVTLPLAATARMQAVIHQLRQQPVNIRVLPGAIGLERISPIRLARSELPGVQLISIADRPISEFALFAKGVFDRLGAATAILLAAPILLGCAIGIRLTSPGPVLFRQPRIGYKGRSFDILKFRTMHATAQPNTMLTIRDDPRVFAFGSFLRKSSFDELPQLFNVLKGDMSLVGPRPHIPEGRAAGRLYFDAVDEYANRHRVKPGMTGWAQVNGWRGPTETIEQIERRVEHDIYYIDNWSLLLDFIIMLKTLLVGFFGKNAF